MGKRGTEAVEYDLGFSMEVGKNEKKNERGMVTPVEGLVVLRG